jgi:hypothetical protein
MSAVALPAEGVSSLGRGGDCRGQHPGSAWCRSPEVAREVEARFGPGVSATACRRRTAHSRRWTDPGGVRRGCARSEPRSVPHLNLTGTWIRDEEATDPSPQRHLRETVRFSDAERATNRPGLVVLRSDSSGVGGSRRCNGDGRLVQRCGTPTTAAPTRKAAPRWAGCNPGVTVIGLASAAITASRLRRPSRLSLRRQRYWPSFRRGAALSSRRREAEDADWSPPAGLGSWFRPARRRPACRAGRLSDGDGLAPTWRGGSRAGRACRLGGRGVSGSSEDERRPDRPAETRGPRGVGPGPRARASGRKGLAPLGPHARAGRPGADDGAGAAGPPQPLFLAQPWRARRPAPVRGGADERSSGRPAPRSFIAPSRPAGSS